MYTLNSLFRVIAKNKDLAEDAVTALMISPYIMDNLKRMNVFVLVDSFGNNKFLRDEDMENIIRYVLNLHAFDILNDFAQKPIKNIQSLLSIANAYLDKYLTKAEQEGKIKRILNPLNDQSYKSTNPNIKYKVENLLLTQHRGKEKRKSIKDYLSQDRSAMNYARTLAYHIGKGSPKEFIPKLIEFLLKNTDPKVYWIVNNANKPYFVIRRNKVGEDPIIIENELYNAELFKFLRKMGIKDKKAPLYELITSSVQQLASELAGTPVTFLDLLKENYAELRDRVIQHVSGDGRVDFFKYFLNEYKNNIEQRAKERMQDPSRKSVIFRSLSDFMPAKGEALTEDDVMDLAEFIMNKHNIEKHLHNVYETRGRVYEEDFYDPAVREAYVQILGNYMVHLLIPLITKTINEVFNKDYILKHVGEFTYKPLNIDYTEFLDVDKIYTALKKGLDHAIQPNKLKEYFNANEVAESAKTITLVKLVQEFIDDVIDEALLNIPKDATDIQTIIERIAQSLRADLSAQLLGDGLDKIITDLIKRGDAMINPLVKHLQTKFNRPNIDQRFVKRIINTIIDNLKELSR